MVKKRVFLAAIALAVLAAGGCLSTPPAAQMFPAGSELFPSVYGAFSELYPNARFASIDFYNNVYNITGITGLALTTPLSYDLSVRLTQNGEISVTHSNLYMRDANGVWSSSNAFGMYNYNRAVETIVSRMIEIADDQDEYERQKNAAMADIRFVYAIMKNFTGLAFSEFINNYARGAIFNISGPISEVSESGREIDGVRYAYVVTLRQSLAERSSDFYFSSILDDSVFCRFYTNQSDVIRLSRTAVFTVSGRLAGASQSAIGTNISLELVDIN